MAKVDPRVYDKAIEDIRAKRAGVSATARRLGVSENSVRKQLARAKAGLRTPPPAAAAPAPQAAPTPAAAAAPGPATAAGPAPDGGLEGFKAATSGAAAPGVETPAQAADAAADARRIRHEQIAGMAIGILRLATGVACRGYAWFTGVALSPEDMAALVAITPTEQKILENAAVPAMPYLEEYLEGSKEGALGLFLGEWATMLSGRIQIMEKVAKGATRAGP